ncbi:TPA: hypothetical protein O8822_002728 [Staphylococcus aureus]|uniref:hypothetical protein n=1 Tax=Cupriavidus TaxID=106589 RepID=UPI00055CE15A|nr:hypothetical protein [Cupriavidus metallidurans]HDC7024507.1 hypothetical protein [Staphylococcus aureus]HDC7066961.1 hypothetical protein [Staphylococcus aureus]HDC7082266.1 hypothetical protein [Staphylococcus aureus]HDC7152156.1 hypothetical protein [Staphylococcus aureus]
MTNTTKHECTDACEEHCREALNQFLQAQSTQVLADRLLQLADRDYPIARELQQWRKISASPEKAPDLQALIAGILEPDSDFISWRQSFAYASRAGAVLPLLAQARARDAVSAVALSLCAMRQVWHVLNQADDSNGEIGGLTNSIGEEFVAALQAAGPQPMAFGDTYLQLLLEDPFGCFDTAAAEAAIGETAVKQYRKALAAHWRAAKDEVLAAKAEHAAQVEKAKRLRRREPYFDSRAARSPRLAMLERMHLAELECTGDIDGALAVLCEDLSEAQDYRQVTEFLDKHGRMREAFVNAERALQMFPNDARLQADMQRCYEREGLVDEVLAISRKRFDKTPSVERYHDVLEAGTAAGCEVDALRAELQATLVALEDQAMTRPGAFAARYRFGPVIGQRDVTLRAEVLCSEERWDEALAVVQRPAFCRDTLLADLARNLEPVHRDNRIALLKRVLVNHMNDATSPYRAELGLVKEICVMLDSTQRGAWLDELRSTYRAKRNFVRDLPAS